MKNLTYLLIGGNIGNRMQNLSDAETFIRVDIGDIIRTSSVYETAAWGNTNQPHFLNKVLLVETELTAVEVLQKIFSIEEKMGRIRDQKNDPRTIDIDILFFNNEIISEKHLTIPHPEIQNRRFVLKPLLEIAPDLMHPFLKKTVTELSESCTDGLEVSIFPLKENI